MYLRATCLMLTALLALFAAPAVSAEQPGQLAQFLEVNCFDCHHGASAEAGLDLSVLPADLDDESVAQRWIRIHDRVRDGEMPPEDYGALDREETVPFLDSLSGWVTTEQQAAADREGRVRARRLTNLQLERSLHDLLGIDIPLANTMPQEPRRNGFTTVAAGQPMSHFQLAEQVKVVDAALDEAFRRAETKGDEWSRLLPASKIVRSGRRSRTREPEMLDGHAVVWMAGVIYYGRIPATEADESGWYRFTIRAKGLNLPESGGVWCSVRTGQCQSSAPLLAWVGAFEATEAPREWTFTAWLPEDHMLEVRPADETLKKGRFAGGQIGTGEGEPQNVPGLAIESIRMERLHLGPNDEGVRHRLFGSFTPGQRNAEAAEQLVAEFAERAFRRPVDDAALEPYLSLVQEKFAEGSSFEEVLRAGYRAVLCSPRFLYFYESPGELDSYAIASRLSYFLWNRPPDDQLLRLAADDRLRDAETLRQQVDRMLNHEHGRNFVPDFAAQWLDLSEIDATEPDRRQFRDFDPIVKHSMLDETHTFVQAILDEDLGCGHLLDSEFTYANSRLARYYGIDGVEGDELRRVTLDDKQQRGGVITQGAILKVTANGSTTSPVIRGVWMLERLLGEHVSPPPPNVPAVEPDVRGATSIREMLVKHQASQDCAACHKKIDPPGFALENFDPAGRWREAYGRGGRGGAEVDPSGVLADGREFDDLEGFRQLMLHDEAPLAKAVAEKLVAYGTGAPVRFADRAELDAIVERAAKHNYGYRSVLHEVVQSDLFLSK